MKDPYEVLGVSRGATTAEVKTAFKKLASQHHPDKNPGDPGAVQRFKEINAAHQILSDPKKRAMYDRFGPAAVGGAGAGSAPFAGVPIDFSDINIDGLFGELLEVLGIRVGDKGHVQAEISVSFEEAAFGCTKTVSYQRVSRCKTCGGSGAARGTKLERCDNCQGRGRIRMQQGVLPIAVERTCSSCQGSGKRVVTPCKDCSGSGMRRSEQSVELEIPAGTNSGATRRVSGRGSAVRGKRPGDLEVIVRVRPHEFFRRSGDDVVCSLPITFAQAVLGDEVEIPTLDGKGIVRVPAGTQPGTILRVRGKGIPRRRMAGRGDQLLEVQVEIPTQLNERQRELVTQLADELGEAVQPQQRTFMEKLRDLFQ